MAQGKHRLDKKEMGERIRISRDKAHLTREALANILDISPSHLADVENGNRGMSLELLHGIATELE